MIRLLDSDWERIREHFPEENIPDRRPGRKPRSDASGARSGALDFEHRRAMAHATAVLSELRRNHLDAVAAQLLITP